jgi:Tfp pilus assembly protein PilV
MKNTLKLHNTKGFLMTEVIVAIAIIAIGLFAVMSLTTTVIKGNTQSKKVTAAITLAQDKMEYFKGIGYDNISGTYTVSNDYYLEALVQNDIPGTNTKTVTVDVYWNPGTKTSNHKATVQTIFAK